MTVLTGVHPPISKSCATIRVPFFTVASSTGLTLIFDSGSRYTVMRFAEE